jgi:hypothetical protein
VRTVDQHLSGHLFNLVLANNHCEGRLPAGSTWVKAEDPVSQSYPLYQTDLIDSDNPWRHDPRKLAKVIIDLFDEKTGPLSGS